MGELRCIEEQLTCRQILQYLWIRADRTRGHLLLGRLAAHAGERRLLGHHTLLIDELDEREAILAADTGIILTECRGDVYDSSTIVCRYVAVCDHEVCALMLLRSRLRCTCIEWLVVDADEVGTLIGLEDLVGRHAVLRERTEYLIQQ